MLREIDSSKIKEVVKELCIRTNYHLPDDTKLKIVESRKKEKSEVANKIFDKMIENYEIADTGFVPICQDTGIACVFLEIGQDVHINGDLEKAINDGVSLGYTEGYLRKSVVKDPFDRVNTKDNTPAFIYYDIVKGDKIKITVAPKGFGSENMSRIAMLKPADGIEGVKKFVYDSVKLAGSNPCPPIVVGVGIGGNFDKVALLAKKALIRPLDKENENAFYKALEEEMLAKTNSFGIGPQGLGGDTTALKVNIEVMPTHIAGLPVAVNINCHVSRHASEVI